MNYTELAMETQENPLIQAVLIWGRETSPEAKDTDCQHFGRPFTEQLRQYLRQRFANNDRSVFGSHRQGYSLVAPTGEEIGVGTTYRGSNKFHIFYFAASTSRKRIAENIYATEVA